MAEQVQESGGSPVGKLRLGLTTQIVIALLLGIGVGVLFPQAAVSLQFLGEIFMAALKMLIMPLILVTMIVGVASLGTPQELGRLGGRAILYYFVTTMLAVLVGLAMVNLMKPGQTEVPPQINQVLQQQVKGVQASQQALSAAGVQQIQQAFETFLQQGVAPTDKVARRRAELLARDAAGSIATAVQDYLQKAKAATKGAKPDLSLLTQRAVGAARAELIISRVGMRRSVKEARAMRADSQRKGPPLTVSRFLYMQIKKILQNPFKALATGNVLGIIVFSIFLGLILVSLGDKGRPAITLADSLNAAMMRFVEWVMLLTPYGVFSLIAYQVATSGFDILFLLGKYMLCVLLALAIHAVIVLPLILFIFGRRSPLAFFSNVRDALGVAFSTSSSSATLPVSLEVVEVNAKVQPKVAGFVLPLGATVNMDGTALYEAIAALFIAQIYGIDLGLGPQILIFATAALAAVGAAGIPSAGTVTMVMVLSAVGLPLSGIGLILAVDRILDMCRTTVNVWGDMIGAAILGKWEEEHEQEASLLADG